MTGRHNKPKRVLTAHLSFQTEPLSRICVSSLHQHLTIPSKSRILTPRLSTTADTVSVGEAGQSGDTLHVLCREAVVLEILPSVTEITEKETERKSETETGIGTEIATGIETETEIATATETR